jgi:hypothetical protein
MGSLQTGIRKEKRTMIAPSMVFSAMLANEYVVIVPLA